LVDELYQQYLVDKNSVDKKWWDIFESLTTENNASAAPAAPTAKAEPSAPPAPAPKTAPAAPVASSNGQGAPRAAAAARTTESAPEAPAPAKAEAAPAKDAAPKTAPIPAQAPKPAPSTELYGEEKRTPLRGPMKAIATNMDASLTVPTATTVRAVPAKVMIDNRIVINNHLKRARGGKIS
ncbi:MAG: 2-oxoglutarate dehydrogenase E1 subunit family protein, partial [Glutamicibacter ardleyensis]